MQIKIFERDNTSGLERIVNDWLSTQPDIEVISIVQSQAARGQFWQYLMTILYRSAPSAKA